jgi:hypothetical protein
MLPHLTTYVLDEYNNQGRVSIQRSADAGIKKRTRVTLTQLTDHYILCWAVLRMLFERAWSQAEKIKRSSVSSFFWTVREKKEKKDLEERE